MGAKGVWGGGTNIFRFLGKFLVDGVGMFFDIFDESAISKNQILWIFENLTNLQNLRFLTIYS